MTLIVAYVSPRYAILASDRMLTQVGLDHHKHREIANKAMLLGGFSILAYAGVANLGGTGDQPTNHYVIETLSGVPSNEYISTLKTGASQQLASLDMATEKLSFISVGYWRIPDAGIVPIIETLANYDTDNPESSPTWSAFNHVQHIVNNGNNDERLMTIGAAPPDGLVDETRRSIYRWRQRNRKKALGIADRMVELIRTAAQSNAGIGSSISVTILPRQDCPAMNVGAGAIPSDPVRSAVSLYAPDGDVLQSEMMPVVDLILPGLSMYGMQIYTGEAARRPIPRPDIDGYFAEFNDGNE